MLTTSAARQIHQAQRNAALPIAVPAIPVVAT